MSARSKIVIKIKESTKGEQRHQTTTTTKNKQQPQATNVLHTEEVNVRRRTGLICNNKSRMKRGPRVYRAKTMIRLTESNKQTHQ